MNFLSAVDYYGVFELDSNQIEEPIKKLVHPLVYNNLFNSCKGDYLSRNHDYYHSEGSVTKLSKEREELAANLPLTGATGYIVADKMSILSGKVAHAAHRYGLKEKYLQAKECLDEDIKNLVDIMNGGQAKRTKFILPKLHDTIDVPKFELDNKPLIKLAVQAICAVERPECVLTPGGGTIFIGPMFKAMGVDYKKLQYSGYKNHDFDKELKLQDCLPFSKVGDLPDDVLIFDDDIYSGKTIKDLQRIVSQEGINVKTGAIETSQYSYYYNDVSYISGVQYRGRYAEIQDSIYTPYSQVKLHEKTILKEIKSALRRLPENEENALSIAYNKKMEELLLSGK